MDIQISDYKDYKNYVKGFKKQAKEQKKLASTRIEVIPKTIDQVRQELYELDHDCRRYDPDDSCSFCYWVQEAEDEELIEKWLELCN